jgi:hypothetical protein
VHNIVGREGSELRLKIDPNAAIIRNLKIGLAEDPLNHIDLYHSDDAFTRLLPNKKMNFILIN